MRIVPVNDIERELNNIIRDVKNRMAQVINTEEVSLNTLRQEFHKASADLDRAHGMLTSIGLERVGQVIQ